MERTGTTESVNRMLETVFLPRGLWVRQHFPAEKLEDPVQALEAEFARPEISGLVKPGMKIAVTAGSRGLAGYVPLLRGLVRLLQAQGAEPFIIPAMGSHGGATAPGQKELLAAYGITEETVGAPVRATMEVVEADRTEAGEPVWVDRYAWEADGIVLFNRIKPHTGFRGDYESGLVKMAAIGLGKQKGAEVVHAGGPARMAERVRELGTRAIRATRVLFGAATVENAYDQVSQVRLLTREELFREEPLLLAQARGSMPRIMLEDLDVLVVERIGKNISGPGMDPNITHTYLPGAAIEPELRAKRARRVAVLDLTEETHGAAMGIGMADTTTRRVFEKMDRDATYPNCLTSGVTVSAKLPMFFDNDRLAIQAAVKTLGGVAGSQRRQGPESGAAGSQRCQGPESGMAGSQCRMVRIRDTLHLGEIWISEALVPEARTCPDIQIVSGLAPLEFDQDGNLL